MSTPPPINPVEFERADFARADAIARRLGYQQTAYTSSSALWGLFCLKENPAHSHGPVTGGCIIKTREFGFLFVADLEDLNLDDLIPKAKRPRGPRHDSCAFYRIESSDVGKRSIRAGGRRWNLGNVIGAIQAGDVGKRVFFPVGADGVIQVENNEQRDARIGGRS